MRDARVLRRCRLRSRSSPPLPNTTVFAGAGALGARKALTPAAHASATISRAMIAAERSTRCYNDDGTGRMRCRPSDFTPHPRADRRRLLSDKIGSCAQCTSSHRPSVSLLEFKVPHGQLRPPRHYKTIRHFSRCPHLDAWSDTRGATRQQQGEARCAGLFASAAARGPIRVV